MLFPIEKQYQELIQRDLEGLKLSSKPVSMGPGVLDLYQTWKKAPEQAEGNAPRGLDLKTKSFERFVEDQVQSRALELLEEKNPSLAEKYKNRSYELLLVSRDGGNHFDEVLTPEDIALMSDIEHESLQFSVLSPIADGTHPLNQVLEEQRAFHIVRSLEDSGFHVQDMIFKDGVYQFKVQDPYAMVDEVRIDTKNSKELLLCEFLNHQQETVAAVRLEELDRFVDAHRAPQVLVSDLIRDAYEQNEVLDDATLKTLGVQAAASILAMEPEMNRQRISSGKISEMHTAPDEQESLKQAAGREMLLRAALQTSGLQAAYLGNVMASKAEVERIRQAAGQEAATKIKQAQVEEEKAKATQTVVSQAIKAQQAQDAAAKKANPATNYAKATLATAAGAGSLLGVGAWEIIQNVVINT